MEKVLDLDKILDVRELVPKDRHPQIMATFAALRPGESFVLVNDHDPRPLLYQFQNEHDGEFDWWPLERGPEAWRVLITRREPTDRTVTEYLQTDHRRLDSTFERFQDAVGGGRWEEASREFRVFSLGLKRHIRAEEEILFPLFEEKTGMYDAGPTAVMRMEHKDIRELLDRIIDETDRKNSGVSDSAGALLNILSEHNMKEEHILYPESDSFLSDHERKEVVKKAQTL